MRCEIIGFPNYEYELSTGDIISRGQRHTTLKIQRKAHRNVRVVMMTQQGKRRMISYDRLVYAIEHGIGYDDIPYNLCILKREVIDRCRLVQQANERVQQRIQAQRIDFIDEKMEELQIMKRAYISGNHDEAVQYIESKKEMIINRHISKYGTSRRTAELCYCQALEMLIEHIDSPASQVTFLTANMMGYMRKVKKQYKLIDYGIERHEFSAGVGA
jgi:hypothetical protein